MAAAKPPQTPPSWHTEQTRPESLQWRTSKLATSLIVVVIVQASVMLGQIALIFSMNHHRSVVPYILTSHTPENRLVEVEPLTVATNRDIVITENELRRYVLERHQIIPSPYEMIRRWGQESFVQRHSSNAVYQAFIPDATEILNMLNTGLFLRDVRIISASPRPENPRAWVIEFQERDLPPNGEGEPTAVREKTSYIDIARVQLPPNPTYEQVLANPTGLVITGYTTLTRNEEEIQAPPQSLEQAIQNQNP